MFLDFDSPFIYIIINKILLNIVFYFFVLFQDIISCVSIMYYIECN